MLFDLEIRAQAGTEYFQPFKTTVEAGTSTDALNRVKRQYPGCDVWVTNSYNKPINRGSSGSSGGSSGGLGGVVFGIIVLGVIGAFAGGGDDKAPAPAPESPAIERSYEAPTRTYEPVYEPAAPVYEAPAPTYEAPAPTPEWDTEDDEDSDDVWWE